MSDTENEPEEGTSELTVISEYSEFQSGIPDAEIGIPDAEISIPEASGSVQVPSITALQRAQGFPFGYPLDLSNPTEILGELGRYAVTENPEYFWLAPNLPAASTVTTTVVETSEWIEVNISELTIGDAVGYNPGPQIKCAFYHCNLMFYSHEAMLRHIEDHRITTPAQQTPAQPANTTISSSYTQLYIVQQFFEEHKKRAQVQKALQGVCDEQSVLELQEVPQEEVRPKQDRFDSCIPLPEPISEPSTPSIEGSSVISEEMPSSEKAICIEPISEPTTPSIEGSALVSEEMPSSEKAICIEPISEPTTPSIEGSPLISEEMPSSEKAICIEPISEPTTPSIEGSPLISEEMPSSAPTSEDTNRDELRKLVIFCAFESCAKHFPSYSEMQTHFRTHGPAYICTECWRAYGNVTLVNLHEIGHKQFKPYKCSFELCGRRFYLSADLRKHTPSHSGDEPYICPHILCDKKFSSRDELIDHIITHVGA